MDEADKLELGLNLGKTPEKKSNWNIGKPNNSLPSNLGKFASAAILGASTSALVLSGSSQEFVNELLIFEGETQKFEYYATFEEEEIKLNNAVSQKSFDQFEKRFEESVNGFRDDVKSIQSDIGTIKKTIVDIDGKFPSYLKNEDLKPKLEDISNAKFKTLAGNILSYALAIAGSLLIAYFTKFFGLLA